MPHLDNASLVFLAMGPAVLVAALAGRLKPGVRRTALLAVATIPSYSFGCMMTNAWLHQPTGWGAPVAIGIPVIGLGIVAIAARFGRRLSTGWRVVLLTAMVTSPVPVLVAIFMHAEGARGTYPRERTFDEELQHARAIALRDRRARAVAERDIPLLKEQFGRCVRELSAASGRAAALTDQEHGSLRLLILGTFEQESASWDLPGIDAEAYVQTFGKLMAGGRPDVVAIRRRRPEAPDVRFEISTPPYGLWSDPWHRYAFMDLNRFTSACDAAVISYSTAYNRKMLMLAIGIG